MEIIEVVTRIPLIQFIPNGNNKYENEQSTKVRVRSSIGIDENSLYYLWTTEKEGITEEKIKEKLTNGDTLTKNTDSGIWYLWIIAKNVDNEVKIERSKGFYLDNDNPAIEGVEEGKTYEELIVTVKDEAGNISSISLVVQNKEKDTTGPTATFTPNGNKKYEKIQETEVKLEDPSGVDEESIMYFWTNSTEPPEKDKFIEKFKNGDTIINDKNTGKLYLWI